MKRIQRKRTKGWRMPEGAIYVGRPTRWGNPFDWSDENAVWMALACGEHGDQAGRRNAAVKMYRWWFDGGSLPIPTADPTPGDIEYADGTTRHIKDLPVGMGVMMWLREPLTVPTKPDLEPLRGHDLVCWCPLDQPCHADVLLELANA